MMRRTRIVPIAVLMLAYAFSWAQLRTGQEILERCARNYSGIKDYVVDLKADVNMERVRIPQMTATLYYKSPDKIFFESPGFALLPREGFGLPVTVLLQRYDATLAGEEKFDGNAAYKLHLVAKDPSARSQQMFLWVDKARFTVLRTETVPYQGRSVKMDFTYQQVEGKYWLPDTMRVELTVPPSDSVAEEGGLPVPAGAPIADMRRPTMRNGTITVAYSNYRVNTGLSDERFKPRIKEER